MAAAVTKTLKLATGICLVPEHEPLALAKQFATLDSYSGGRVLFGIGAGWLREESDLFGVDFPHRWTETAEIVAAMRKLWTEDAPSFDGKYVKFPAVKSLPKPAQKSGPPVLIGSLDKNALKRVAKWADGWCPIALNAAQLKTRIDELKRECDGSRQKLRRTRHHDHGRNPRRSRKGPGRPQRVRGGGSSPIRRGPGRPDLRKFRRNAEKDRGVVRLIAPD